MTIRNFHQLRVLGRSHGVGHWLLLPVLFVAASLDQLGLVRLASDSIMRCTPGCSACLVENLCGSAYKTVSLCVCVWVFACLGRRAGQSRWAEPLGRAAATIDSDLTLVSARPAPPEVPHPAMTMPLFLLLSSWTFCFLFAELPVVLPCGSCKVFTGHCACTLVTSCLQRGILSMR